MALKSTFVSNPVKTILVEETASTNSSNNNVAGGAAYIVAVTIDNSQLGATVYTKLYDASSAVVGTTAASLVLQGHASALKTYHFHPPLYFANGVSFATTTTAGQAGTPAPGTPPKVLLLLSSTAS